MSLLIDDRRLTNAHTGWMNGLTSNIPCVVGYGCPLGFQGATHPHSWHHLSRFVNLDTKPQSSCLSERLLKGGRCPEHNRKVSINDGNTFMAFRPECRAAFSLVVQTKGHGMISIDGLSCQISQQSLIREGHGALTDGRLPAHHRNQSKNHTASALFAKSQ